MDLMRIANTRRKFRLVLRPPYFPVSHHSIQLPFTRRMLVRQTQRLRQDGLLPQGEPPALPGWLSEFDISGSMFFAVWARIARVCAAALYCTMAGCEKAPLRGPQP